MSNILAYISCLCRFVIEIIVRGEKSDDNLNSEVLRNHITVWADNIDILFLFISELHCIHVFFHKEHLYKEFEAGKDSKNKEFLMN